MCIRMWPSRPVHACRLYVHVGAALLLQRTRLHLPETAHPGCRSVYLCGFCGPHALYQTRSIPDRSFQHVCYRSPAPESSTLWQKHAGGWGGVGVCVQKHRKPPQLPSFIWSFAVAPNTSTRFSITAPLHYLRMESSFKRRIMHPNSYIIIHPNSAVKGNFSLTSAA